MSNENKKSSKVKGDVFFTDGKDTVKLEGIFTNGDAEVKCEDGELLRVTKAAFEVDYKGIPKDKAKSITNKANEISKPVLQELDYVKTQTVTVIGRFKDGDYEVINSNDATDSWRVPKDTFESTYKEVPVTYTIADDADLSDIKLEPGAVIPVPTNEVKDNETDETNAEYEQKDSISEESDPRNTVVTLSITDLEGKSLEEIKAAYNMDELRTLAKACQIRGASQMKEDKLIGKLLAKAE